VCLSSQAPPGNAEFELAVEAFECRRMARALALLDRAESAGHDPDLCSAYRWTCRMLQGRFEEAWRESDRIASRGAPDANRLWDGRSFHGRHVMIRCLHGYGDAIQFIRYAALVRRTARRVTIQTHPQLVSLMRGMPFADHVITWPETAAENAAVWDQQIEVMELPRAFRTTLETIPCEVPYLFVNPQTQARARVPAAHHDRFRVGLQWGSGEWDPARSLALTELLPLLDVPAVEFYSFQRGPCRAELQQFAATRTIHDVSGDCPQIVEAAADLLNIDLLITVDTMLAHLAGALAVPVWVLLPYRADWRWMLSRCDSPWYPTMRLFRQSAPGDWSTPIHRISHALRRERSERAFTKPQPPSPTPSPR
jgi:hypothetical protein